MKSVLAYVFLASSLAAGSVQAAEAGQRISMESAEGQVIIRKVVDISERLGLPNPFVPAEPEPAITAREARIWGYRPIMSLRDIQLRHGELDGRSDTLRYQTRLASGAQEKLQAERRVLLSRLDLDAETQARAGLSRE